MLFFEKIRIKIIIFLFTIALYLTCEYYLNNFSNSFSSTLGNTDRIAVFVITTGCISGLIHLFVIEINQYIQDLKDKNNKLTTAYNEIERFAYVASHNLKTPIRMIRSFSDLISRDLKRNKTHELEEYLEYVKSGATQMQLLVTDILEYSKLNQNEDIKLEVINLIEVIDFIKIQANFLHPKEIQWSYSTLPQIHSNKTFIIAIFQNLIENAIKYNNSNIVEIDIQVKEEYNQHIISISDNGIGIDAQYFDKIFEMFERLQTEALYEGTGIGLAMTKKIVSKLGGEIWVTSKLDVGSTFSVQLPILKKIA